MYLCGACRRFEDPSLKVAYAHTTQCTDFYFDRPDYQPDLTSFIENGSN